tara:strand:- start:2750 stop:3280 length:531 start_codon:yes stop_codon:yes gene_type:complete
MAVARRAVYKTTVKIFDTATFDQFAKGTKVLAATDAGGTNLETIYGGGASVSLTAAQDGSQNADDVQWHNKQNNRLTWERNAVNWNTSSLIINEQSVSTSSIFLVESSRSSNCLFFAIKNTDTSGNILVSIDNGSTFPIIVSPGKCFVGRPNSKALNLIKVKSSTGTVTFEYVIAK